MDLEDVVISARNQADQAQDRDYWRALENAALDLRVPKAMGLVSRLQFATWDLNMIPVKLSPLLTCLNSAISGPDNDMHICRGESGKGGRLIELITKRGQGLSLYALLLCHNPNIRLSTEICFK